MHSTEHLPRSRRADDVNRLIFHSPRVQDLPRLCPVGPPGLAIRGEVISLFLSRGLPDFLFFSPLSGPSVACPLRGLYTSSSARATTYRCNQIVPIQVNSGLIQFRSTSSANLRLPLTTNSMLKSDGFHVYPSLASSRQPQTLFFNLCLSASVVFLNLSNAPSNLSADRQ